MIHELTLTNTNQKHSSLEADPTLRAKLEEQANQSFELKSDFFQDRLFSFTRLLPQFAILAG
jgi:hypothetical protein